ncbi:MAG: hypothetical protein ACREX7_07840, partial [Casimicrobiaceae bacterium]
IAPPVHEDFRAGDVRHSQADVSKAMNAFNYAPTHDLRAGLSEALPWYESRRSPVAAARDGRLPDVRGTA